MFFYFPRAESTFINKKCRDSLVLQWNEKIAWQASSGAKAMQQTMYFRPYKLELLVLEHHFLYLPNSQSVTSSNRSPHTSFEISIQISSQTSERAPCCNRSLKRFHAHRPVRTSQRWNEKFNYEYVHHKKKRTKKKRQSFGTDTRRL